MGRISLAAWRLLRNSWDRTPILSNTVRTGVLTHVLKRRLSATVTEGVAPSRKRRYLLHHDGHGPAGQQASVRIGHFNTQADLPAGFDGAREHPHRHVFDAMFA